MFSFEGIGGFFFFGFVSFWDVRAGLIGVAVELIAWLVGWHRVSVVVINWLGMPLKDRFVLSCLACFFVIIFCSLFCFILLITPCPDSMHPYRSDCTNRRCDERAQKV